jgi:hypothetical protein
VNKRLKLDMIYLSNLNSTKPCPIKVTDEIPASNNMADKKAVETAMTGKVTAVVMVMHCIVIQI